MDNHEFVIRIWPKDGVVLPAKCYQDSPGQNDGSFVGVGVGAALVTSGVDVNWFESPETQIPKRASLYLNERRRRLDFVSFPVGSLQYCETIDSCIDTGRPVNWNLSWVPVLNPGKYDALLVIERDNGELLEYNWSFILTE